ncbi:general stress protein [Kocuria sp.]|uniref:general stress protein n=1 Tax=Kocuria sp. TaxID=1871328 RepID=UPI0026DF7338|nr:general stress protein [Kocuria sp.]MDO5617173.1 ECF transporter S component [Kocuria sp.]
MSFFGQRASTLAPTGLPEGQAIGSFSQYADAQKVVDHLSDQQFDVQTVSIVGHDLRSVERVTGRLSYPRVALASATQGAMFGLFFGVILAMFGGGGWGMSVLLTVLLGAAFWVILGVVSFAAQRGRRDFTSVSTFVASRYDVVVRGDVAPAARQAVQGLNLPGLQHGAVQQGWNQQQGWNGQQGPVPGAAQGQRQPGPYGQYGQAGQPGRAPTGASSNGAAAPANGAVGQQPPQPESRPVTAPGEEDLPDGRPRYGVRIEPEQPAESSAGQESGPAEQQPGSTH